MRFWPKKRTDRIKDNYAETVAENQIQASRDEVLPDGFVESLKLRNSETLKWAPGRHLLVFLDGTWNEERVPIGEVTPTNVLRMFHEVNKQCLPNGEQTVLARYYRGVGSRQDNSAADRMWFGFNGKDEQRIRAAAFAGLYRDYRSLNDAIYIIGFSRGAACAPLLARDICIKGLPPQLKVQTRHFANLLTGQIEARVETVERADESDNIFPEIRFLVAGIPWTLLFYHRDSRGNTGKTKSFGYSNILFHAFSEKSGFATMKTKSPKRSTRPSIAWPLMKPETPFCQL